MWTLSNWYQLYIIIYTFFLYENFQLWWPAICGKMLQTKYWTGGSCGCGVILDKPENPYKIEDARKYQENTKEKRGVGNKKENFKT